MFITCKKCFTNYTLELRSRKMTSYLHFDISTKKMRVSWSNCDLICTRNSFQPFPTPPKIMWNYYLELWHRQMTYPHQWDCDIFAHKIESIMSYLDLFCTRDCFQPWVWSHHLEEKMWWWLNKLSDLLLK